MKKILHELAKCANKNYCRPRNVFGKKPFQRQTNELNFKNFDTNVLENSNYKLEALTFFHQNQFISYGVIPNN